MNEILLELKDITKFYGTNCVLNSANIKLKKSEIISIIGVSGSGKSTLLHIAGLLDNADSGEVIINSQKIITNSRANFKSNEYSNVRMQNMGFVYQKHYLLNDFTVLENIKIPLILSGKSDLEASKRSKMLMEIFNIEDKANFYPEKLSGGEQQRVSIARAMSNYPSIILADEPTGNLDQKNSENVFNILRQACKNEGIGCVIVTHNIEMATKCDYVYKIVHGVLSLTN